MDPQKIVRSHLKKAAVIVSHGSKAKNFDKDLKRLIGKIRRGGEFNAVVSAYLEINSPSIPEAIDACVRKGAREVRVLPYFLLSGRHVTEHIPAIVAGSRRTHKKKARIILCPYLGFHEKIVFVAKERLLRAR